MDNLSFQKTFIRFVFFFVLSVIILLLDRINFLNFPKKIAYLIVSPMEIGIYSISESVSSQFAFLSFWKNGYQEISYLKQKNLELSVEAGKVKSLAIENEILKKEFTKSQKESRNLLPAHVVGLSRYLLLDKGTKDGVKKGQTVLFGEILVGRIISAQDHLAKVILPTDPEEKIIVTGTKNGAKGVLGGSFGEDLVLDQVLQADKIEAEETLVTSGSDGFPLGIMVAKINKIAGRKSDVFQFARAKSLLEYSKLNMVFVKIK